MCIGQNKNNGVKIMARRHKNPNTTTHGVPRLDADNDLQHIIDEKKVFFSRSKPNLFRIGNRVFSYQTHVATIKHSYLLVKPKYENFSATTSNHLATVESDLKLKRVLADSEFTELALET